MELMVFELVAIVLCVQTFNAVSSISMKQLRERMDILELRIENRFDYEQSQRHKDFESIMTKFSEITTRMDTWEEKFSLSDTKMDKTKHTVGVSEDIDSKQHDMFKYLMQGLQDEKKRARKMMREILRLGKEIHEAQTRKENDDSLIDSVLYKSNSELKEQLNNLNQSLVERIETVMTESIAAGKTLREDLKSSIQKMCNVENTKTMIETTIKQLFMDIYPSSVTNISAASETSICSCSETNISTSSENRRTTLTSIIKSCKDGLSNGYQMNGVYTINGIDKYCDQTTDGGGWTVFQRRINGVVDFDRDWNSYKHGFGNISGEFWLGNDYLSGKHNLGYHELRIDMEDFEGNRAHAEYDRFRIDPESNNYTLHIGGYSGNVSNTFRFHNGYKFSTKDVDLDEWKGGSCAQKHSGGWWYRDNICSFANLNGKYHLNRGYKDGAYWSGWKGGSPLKFVEMKFR